MGQNTQASQDMVAVGPVASGEGVPMRWNHLKVYVLVSAVLSLYFCELLCIIGGGFLAPQVAAVIGGMSLVAWPSLVSILFTVALGAIICQASDYWGRKWFLIIPNIGGIIGCIISARATSMGMYIAGFCVGGLGFGSQGLFLAVVSEVLPRELRPWSQAGANFVNAFGSIFALSVGGYLVQAGPEGFRTYLYITAGIYAASVGLVTVLYNPPPRNLQTALSFKEKIRSLDWIGYILLAGGTIPFCLGLSWAQNPYTWKNSHVLGPLLVGSVLLIILGIYAWKFNKTGLFHHQLFHHRNYVISLAALAAEGSSYMAAGIYFPASLSVVRGATMSPYRQSLCYMVGFCSFAVITLVTGLYVAKTKTVRLTGVLTFVMMLCFYIPMATVNLNTPEANFWGYICFFGAGLGLAFVTFFTAAQFATAPELIAVTTGLGVSIRSFGGSVALAIFNALAASGYSKNVLSQVTNGVVPLGLPEETIGPLIGGLAAGNMSLVEGLTGITPAIVEAASLGMKQARLIGFRDVFICASCFSFLAMIASAFLNNPTSEFNKKIDAPIEAAEQRINDPEDQSKIAHELQVEYRGNRD
ncbi:hypothetical protein LTR84_005857 [Exophiala bonariae]|uniref:Major facilitator superfamily (MFS) profile domain-containing protein n=1 Tax=Exophiala bonariae TaxID=1690606 RepID=A0AAV9N269_9EURO|nr:hypothetical protein LTR84_005857 [Exophiala bonariae]